MNLYKVKVIDDNVVDYSFILKSNSLLEINNILLKNNSLLDVDSITQWDIGSIIGNTDIELLRKFGITLYKRIISASRQNKNNVDYYMIYIINLDHIKIDNGHIHNNNTYHLSNLFDVINKTIKRDIKINSIYESI